MTRQFGVQYPLFYGIINIMQKQGLDISSLSKPPNLGQDDPLYPTPRLYCMSSDVPSEVKVGRINLRPAVFLDRDGTINEERGYLCDPGAVTLLPKTCEALALLRTLDIPIIVLTNQSALGRGLMNEAEFRAVNAALWMALQACHTSYDALYYCPHRPDREPPCVCRKPRPGLLLQAAIDYDLDLSRSFIIGDKMTDLEAGYAANCHTILVRTGFGETSYRALTQQSRQPDFVATTLLEAAQWVRCTIAR